MAADIARPAGYQKASTHRSAPLLPISAATIAQPIPGFYPLEDLGLSRGRRDGSIDFGPRSDEDSRANPRSREPPMASPPPPVSAGSETREDVASLAQRFQRGEAAIGVIGLGYVGLPLAQAIANKGFRVTGFDIDPAKIEMLNAGESYIRHVPAAGFAALRQKGLFSATADFSRLAGMDAILICVPTPLNRYREPDLSYVEATTAADRPASPARPAHRPGDHHLSRHLPGGPEAPAGSRRADLRPGFLPRLFSPEREDPGNADFDTGSIPKVVGGDGDAALKLATALYGQIVVKVVPVSSARGGRGGEAQREHLPRRQHRPGQRAEARLRRAWASTSGR